MTEQCTKCNKTIEEGDGRYNFPDGVQCDVCGTKKYDKQHRTVKQPKTIDIGGVSVPSKLLLEYASKVEMTRNAAVVGTRNNDPLVIMKALHERVVIHKKIFKIAGLDHDDFGKNATKVREALEKWLNENTFIEPQLDGLV